MNESFDCLRDPENYEKLTFKDNKLLSTSGSHYEIINKIPRFVKDSSYSDAFGFQWKKFNKTQLDSYSGLQLSEKRLASCLGFHPSLLKDKLVLEAGSGAGRFTEILIKYKSNIHSFDNSVAVEPNAINHSNYKNLVLVQADIRKIPFKKLNYDFVICLGVLQHTPNPEESMLSLWSMVKPGGKLIIDHYRFQWRTFLPPPIGQALNIYRFIILRLPKLSRFKYVKKLVDFWFPIHWKFRKSYFMTRVLRRLSPVIFHYHYLSLKNKDMYYQWSLLDTHDSTTDHYRHLRTKSKIKNFLKKIGAEDIVIKEAGNGIEASCTKPQKKY